MREILTGYHTCENERNANEIKHLLEELDWKDEEDLFLLGQLDAELKETAHGDNNKDISLKLMIGNAKHQVVCCAVRPASETHRQKGKTAPKKYNVAPEERQQMPRNVLL